MDGNVVLKSKKVSKSISKKKSRKKAKPNVETEEHISKDDSMVDVETSVKDDFLSIEDHSASHVTTDTLPESPVKPTLSDNEEPPEGFSFDDARQQIMMEEEHVKQHVARSVYMQVVIANLADRHTYTYIYTRTNIMNKSNLRNQPYASQSCLQYL